MDWSNRITFYNYDKFCRKLYDLTKVPHKPLDYAMIPLEGIQRLPITKITYFQNLIVCYKKMEKVTYRHKEKILSRCTYY